MKLALVALSKHGKALGQRIRTLLPQEIDFYLQESQVGEGEEIIPFPPEKLSNLVGELFNRYQGIIFIMALGIVVRKIAPYIQDKRQDPAVVVMDEKGQAVISVLSGHLGGANQLTRELAEALGSQPVITTATDVHQRIAFDLLAQKLNCQIKPFQNLKKVSGAVVNDQQVNVFSQYPLPLQETEQLKIYPLEDYPEKDQGEATVLVTNQALSPPQQKPYVFLIPRNIAVGIGCRRGVTKERILEAIRLALAKSNLDPASIACLTSIDIKQDEEGLLQAAQELQTGVKFFSPEEILQLEGEYASSQFVKNKIGVNGVCEQTAMLALKKPKLVLPKSVLVPGVTVAIAMEPSLL